MATEAAWKLMLLVIALLGIMSLAGILVPGLTKEIVSIQTMIMGMANIPAAMVASVMPPIIRVAGG